MSNIYSWQKEIWQTLTRNFATQQRCHALLLKGHQGIGKFDFSRYFAKSLLCDHAKEDIQACGTCQSCHWFEQGAHPNFYQVVPEALSEVVSEDTDRAGAEETAGNSKSKKKASQQISVGQIRNLTDFVYMSGHQSGYKIVLIYPSEAMNKAAANALLKKLEEPPEQVLFILVTHHPQHLPPTIRSRCQQITMPAPDVKTSLDWLVQQAVKDPQSCLTAAGLAPLTALQFNDSELFAQHEQFIQQISSPMQLNPISLALTMQQVDLSTLVSWLQKWCYDLVSYAVCGKVRYYHDQQAMIESLAANINTHACITYVRTLYTHQRLSQHPLNPRLFLEEIFLSYIQLVNEKAI